MTPRVLTEKDIANEFVNLFAPQDATDKSFKPLQYFGDALTKSPTGTPILFVFDNFETVRNPADLFEWLDMRIRLPNKILITTRNRDFKADYPIEVSGMTEDEANKLITAVAARLNIQHLLTDQYSEQVYQEADGHPYIIKVLLGEVAKENRLVKVERIVASKDEMLDALFERTYVGLSSAAKRVYLTLCRWRSFIPQVALEAVLIRPTNEKMDVEDAVEELIRSSFVEGMDDETGARFLNVPLVGSVFGRRKLEVSHMKAAIEADVDLLQELGATQVAGLRLGIQPRIERLFRYVAKELSRDSRRYDEYITMLEFLCR